MSKPNKTGLAGPAIAVGIILAVFVIYQFIFNVEPGAPKPPPPSAPASSPATPDRAALPASKPVAPAPAVSGEVPAVKRWSTYHGGADLCGYASLHLSKKPTIVWQYIAAGNIRQPPVADEKGIYAATTNGWVVALDFDGGERWKQRLVRTSEKGEDTPELLNAPIACFRSTVLIGSNAGIVHALNADTGERRWTYDAGGEVLGTVNVYEPPDTAQPALAYVLERGKGVLHCINLRTGAPMWKTDPIARTDGSVAVADGNLAFGSCDYAFHIYGAPEGRRINTVPLCPDCQVADGPALLAGDLYSGSRSGRFYRVDLAAGKIVWTNQDSTKDIFTTAALAADVVVFGSDDGGVYCLDRATGAKRWRYDVNAVPTSPVIAADTVLAGAGGALIALALDSGQERWRYEISDAITSPSIIDDMVVVGSDDGTVVVFGEKAGQ